MSSDSLDLDFYATQVLLGKKRGDKGDSLRFLQAALTFEGDECLFWPFAKTQFRLRIGDKLTNASRWLCEEVRGAPPTPRHQAAHSCGNGHLSCVNPRHLRWATPKENSADQLIHGTRMRGKVNPKTRLKESSVIKIKAMLKTGASPARLARLFKVSPGTISAIKSGKSWAWIDDRGK